jgi:hypothetical protein
MPRKKAKKARKPVKFKTITLKITAKQKKSLINFCWSRHTTPNKVIKKAIRPLLENYGGLDVEKPAQVKANQLQLF